MLGVIGTGNRGGSLTCASRGRCGSRDVWLGSITLVIGVSRGRRGIV